MRSRRNNTTLTRKVDKWNPRKVWLIKRYADGHYAINQEVGGRVFIPATRERPRRRSPRSSPAAKNAKIPGNPGPSRKEHTMKYDPNVYGYVNGNRRTAETSSSSPSEASALSKTTPICWPSPKR